MKTNQIALIGIMLLGMGLVSGCVNEPEPEGALSVSELLAEPVYDTEVTIYGQVSQLGELRCPCFELTSGGKSVMVWYAWYEDEWPTVSVEGIQNGDRVIVSGELKMVGVDRLNEFAASKIERGE
jgi:hypothetical protein